MTLKETRTSLAKIKLGKFFDFYANFDHFSEGLINISRVTSKSWFFAKSRKFLPAKVCSGKMKKREFSQFYKIFESYSHYQKSNHRCNPGKDQGDISCQNCLLFVFQNLSASWEERFSKNQLSITQKIWQDARSNLFLLWVPIPILKGNLRVGIEILHIFIGFSGFNLSLEFGKRAEKFLNRY